MLKRIGPVLAGLIAVAALAIGVPTATGHPEECVAAAAWSSTDGGYSPYLSWQGAEESACLSKSATSRYDDSDAKLTRSNQKDNAGLRLLASRSKQGVFGPYAAFNSDLAFENGYAYQGNYEGVTIWDVRDPSNPTLVNQIVCPGSQNDVTINDGILITSTDARRSNGTCSSSSVPSPTPAQPDPPGVWEGLKVFDVRDPMNPDAARQRGDGLRLAHAHRAARGEPPARLRLVVRHRRRPDELRHGRGSEEGPRQDLRRRGAEVESRGREGDQRAAPVPGRRQPR